jgi:hypothetical protein
MSDRFHASLGVLCIVAAIAAWPVWAGGQTPVATKNTTASKNWAPPLAPDGHPDLQGIWLNNSATPLERPKALEGRQFLTDEEVAELKKRAARLFADGNADFPGGDSVFLAALANVEQYKSPGSTGSSAEMIDREFDNRTSLIIDPIDGRMPALTAEGRQRQVVLARSKLPPDPSGPEDLASDIRCITFGTPRVGGNYGAGHFGYYQIVQTPGHVVVTTEVIHEARIVPMDGRAHLPQSIRQWNGDPRGHWQGNTLVVDTTNFSPQSYALGSAERLHLVERFTRVAPDTIDYEVTFDDPTTWARPWTAVLRLRHTDDKMYEFACHEGNYDIMRGILGGARAVEKGGFDVKSQKR